MGVSETGSVRVSWEAVENADYYTVSFSQAVGDDQEGLCRDDSHSASVTVHGHIVGYTVQYGVQQSGGLVLTKEVTGNWSSGGETDLTGLTPSTKYTIAVAAVNEEGTVGLYSDPVTMETEAEFSDHLSTLSQEYGQEDTAKSPEVAPIIIGAALTLFGVLMATCGIIIGCVLCTRSVSH